MSAIAQRELDELLPPEPEPEFQLLGLHLLRGGEGPAPDPDFVESVAMLGVRVPIEVEETERGFRVRDGRRRIAAAKAAGLTHLAAMVYPEDRTFRGAVVALALNAQRAANPVAELDAIRELADQDLSIPEIARLTRVPTQTIKKRLRLGALDERIERGLRAGRVPVSVAEEAAKLPQERQAILAATLEEAERLTLADVREAKAARRAEAAAELPLDLFAAPTPAAFDWRAEAARALGALTVLISDDQGAEADAFVAEVRDLIARYRLEAA